MLLATFTTMRSFSFWIKGFDAETVTFCIWDDGLDLSELQRNSLSGHAIGIALWGCVLGSLVAGPIASYLGRKAGMLVAAALFFISSVLSGYPEFGFAPTGAMGVDALTPFMVYRFIGGVAIGMASLISPMYIAEVAPPRLRGLLVSFQQIAIVVGIVLVYYVNMRIAAAGSGNDAWVLSTGWRYMLVSCAVPAALFFLAALLMPDSPRWYLQRGRRQEARALLHRLNDPVTAELTYAEIKSSISERQNDRLLSYGFGVLVIGILLSVFQQFVGINAVCGGRLLRRSIAPLAR